MQLSSPASQVCDAAPCHPSSQQPFLASSFPFPPSPTQPYPPPNGSKGAWLALRRAELDRLVGSQFRALPQHQALAMLSSRQLGVARLRFLPKRAGAGPPREPRACLLRPRPGWDGPACSSGEAVDASSWPCPGHPPHPPSPSQTGVRVITNLGKRTTVRLPKPRRPQGASAGQARPGQPRRALHFPAVNETLQELYQVGWSESGGFGVSRHVAQAAASKTAALHAPRRGERNGSGLAPRAARPPAPPRRHRSCAAKSRGNPKRWALLCLA